MKHKRLFKRFEILRGLAKKYAGVDKRLYIKVQRQIIDIQLKLSKGGLNVS